MCVIAVSKRGADQPSERVMREMWDANPHGAGYMFARNGRVYIHKGFMDVEDFLAAVKRERFGKDDPVVYHFRISTQGGVNPQMTHPFPLATDLDAMEWLDLSCACGVAHNGIITRYSTPACKATGYSDTALFITDYLSRVIRTSDDLHSDVTMSDVEKAAGSKLAILDKSGDIVTVGKFTSSGGILYSNDYWCWPKRYGYYKPSRKIRYNDWYGWGVR